MVSGAGGGIGSCCDSCNPYDCHEPRIPGCDSIFPDGVASVWQLRAGGGFAACCGDNDVGGIRELVYDPDDGGCVWKSEVIDCDGQDAQWVLTVTSPTDAVLSITTTGGTICYRLAPRIKFCPSCRNLFKICPGPHPSCVSSDPFNLPNAYVCLIPMGKGTSTRACGVCSPHANEWIVTTPELSWGGPFCAGTLQECNCFVISGYTFVMDLQPGFFAGFSCRWFSGVATEDCAICGFTNSHTRSAELYYSDDPGSLNFPDVTLIIEDYATYVLPFDEWDCAGPNVMNLESVLQVDGRDACDGFPSTITVYPNV